MNNIDTIKNFLTQGKNETLLINQVSEETGIFYETAIKMIASRYNIKIFSSYIMNQDIEVDDLFNTKKIFMHTSTNQKKVKELAESGYQKIIFTDYKNYKKFKELYKSINGYDFEKDIINFLKEFFDIVDSNLINYCINQPYLLTSETSKYIVNNKSYINDTSINNIDNFILNIRRDVFKLKKTSVDLRKLFFLLKEEVKIKRFNFLIY